MMIITYVADVDRPDSQETLAVELTKNVLDRWKIHRVSVDTLRPSNRFEPGQTVMIKTRDSEMGRIEDGPFIAEGGPEVFYLMQKRTTGGALHFVNANSLIPSVTTEIVRYAKSNDRARLPSRRRVAREGRRSSLP